MLASTIGYVMFWALVSFYPSPVDSPGFVQSVIDRILNMAGDVGLGSIVNYSFIEAAANLLFYVPIGVLLDLIFMRAPFWQKLYFAFGVSLAAETLQGLFISRRVSSWQDVLHNVFGAVIGLLLARQVKSKSRHDYLDKAESKS